jgi:hypothetical protein
MGQILHGTAIRTASCLNSSLCDFAITALLDGCCFSSRSRNQTVASPLQAHAEVGSLWQNLADTHPHLFAATPAFILSEILSEMTRVVETIERLEKSF